jgi:spore coat polysaccharide biosynthesis protein SpsF
MRVVAIVQARMNSARFPGKIMAPLAGKRVLDHVVDRLAMASTIDSTMIATTGTPVDDVVEQYCKQRALYCFRGSEEDVLDRIHGAAETVQADTIVRITADCPLLDPEVVDVVVSAFKRGAFDYVANTLIPTYPDGLDTEVFSREALNRAQKSATLSSEREHVTPYIWKHPELFRLYNVRNDHDYSNLRWTIDEPSDLNHLQSLFDMASNSSPMLMRDIISLLELHPKFSDPQGRPSRNEGYRTSLLTDSEVKREKTS